MRALSAFILQCFSYATTLSATAFLMRPASELWWFVTAVIALLVELAFIGMKEAFFTTDPNPVVGAIGLLLDWVTNTGGILPYGSRILTWGPLALMLGVLGVDMINPTVKLIGGALVSVIVGLILSIAPHLLWKRRRAQRTDRAK